MELAMHQRLKQRHGAILLDVLLVLAFVILILQLWPSFGVDLLRRLDARSWSRTTWFMVNLGILGVLLTIRYSPQMLIDWHDWRKQRVVRQQKAEAKRRAKKEREAIERIIEGRKRRI